MPRNYVEPVLSPKHFKALELLEEQILTYKEIAIACGWSPSYFYGLMEGSEQKCGALAFLFKAELASISQRSSAKIKEVTKDNKQIALRLMNDRLKQLKKSKMNKEKSYEVAKLTAVLAKSTPNVEMSLTYFKGLTKEELENEFRKFATLASRAIKPNAVPRTEQN